MKRSKEIDKLKNDKMESKMEECIVYADRKSRISSSSSSQVEDV